MRTNYSIDKKKDCINHIFDLLYNYDLKLKINQLKYNYKISNNFKNICNKGLNMININSYVYLNIDINVKRVRRLSRYILNIKYKLHLERYEKNK